MSRFVQKYFSRMFRETQNRVNNRDWFMLKRLYQMQNWALLGYRLREITRDGLCGEEKALLDFYYECLIHLKENLDPYTLAEIVEVIVRSMSLCNKPLDVLFNMFDAVLDSPDALQLIRILHGQILLYKYCNFNETKVIVDELRTEIESENDDIEMRNYCKYHVLAAAYYFKTKQWAESFRSRMKYLKYDLKSYPKNLWAEQAFLLAINAMLIEDKYEFGDVQHHTVMQGLRNDTREWMLDVFNAFRLGKSERFKELRYYWMKVPELYDNIESIKQRVYVLNFLAMASQRTIFPCYIHFVEIAMELRLAVDDVLCIVKRALNSGYMEAKFSMTNKVIEVYWVKSMFTEPLVEFDLYIEEEKDFDFLLLCDDIDKY